MIYVSCAVYENDLENRCFILYDIVSPTKGGWLHLHELRKLFTKQLKLIRYD
jgi:hypothetical protein